MAAHSSSSSTLESDPALLAGVLTDAWDLLIFEYYDFGLLTNDFGPVFDIATEF